MRSCTGDLHNTLAYLYHDNLAFIGCKLLARLFFPTAPTPQWQPPSTSKRSNKRPHASPCALSCTCTTSHDGCVPCDRLLYTHQREYNDTQSSVKAFDTFDIHILTVADFLDHLAALPTFSLVDVEADTRHTLSIIPAATVSAAKVRANAHNATAERWVHQQDHDFHSSVLPYVLELNMTLEDVRRARHTGFKLCINDWYVHASEDFWSKHKPARRYQCAMLPVELLQWHNPAVPTYTNNHRRLIEPFTEGAPSLYVLTKPLYALPPAFACSLLMRRLEHHAALGFDGVLLYERGQMMPELLHVRWHYCCDVDWRL